MKEDKEFSLDLIGLGKLAKSIPKTVYEKFADTTLSTFEKLVAPITATTNGIGIWLGQKFENMANYERVLAQLSIYEAIEDFKTKNETSDFNPSLIRHPKSFIDAVVETSKETDLHLHQMWVHLLSNTFQTGKSHPYYVHALRSLGPEEARLLNSLLPYDQIGENRGGYISFAPFDGLKFIRKNGDDSEDWPETGIILYQLNLIDFKVAKGEKYNDETTIPHLSDLGCDFLRTVTDRQ